MNHADDPRSTFRVLIDYIQAFEVDRRHEGMLLWRPHGLTRKGVDYTDIVMSSMLNHTLQLGILTDDQHNEWTTEMMQVALQRFCSQFDVVKTEQTNLEPITEPSCSGTAQATLRHKTSPEYMFTLRFLKKAALAPDFSVFLIDDEGHSLQVKRFKRIKVFTLDFITNTAVMEPWLHTQTAKRRKRKIYTPEEKAARAQRIPKTRTIIMDDHHTS